MDINDLLNMLKEQSEDKRRQIYCLYASACREDQWPSTKNSFDNLSDTELFEFVFYDLGCPRTTKQLYDAFGEKRKTNHVNASNAASNHMHPYAADKADREEINRELCKSHPSDCIKLTRETDIKLVDLWLGKERVDHFVPSDLFFAGTIPLMDCEIEVDERGYMENGQLCKYRVCIFDSYKERIKDAPINSVIDVGAIVFYSDYSYKQIYPFSVIPGYDHIGGRPIYFTGITEEAEKQYMQHVSEEQIGNAAVEFLQTWYGIQIALLNPMTKDIFANPQREPVAHSNNGKPRKKKPVRYVKVHRIFDDELDSRMYVTEGKRKIRRKTMLWYVIGHWRHYKNGKVIFIQPYWKGPLRNTKEPLGPREREIVTDGISIDNSTESVHN